MTITIPSYVTHPGYGTDSELWQWLYRITSDDKTPDLLRSWFIYQAMLIGSAQN